MNKGVDTMKPRFAVYHEPTAGRDIYEGRFDTFEEAMAEAEKHLEWAQHWNKALYIKETPVGTITYLVRGNR
jgi:hypothetical protein